MLICLVFFHFVKIGHLAKKRCQKFFYEALDVDIDGRHVMGHRTAISAIF